MKQSIKLVIVGLFLAGIIAVNTQPAHAQSVGIFCQDFTYGPSGTWLITSGTETSDISGKYLIRGAGTTYIDGRPIELVTADLLFPTRAVASITLQGTLAYGGQMAVTTLYDDGTNVAEVERRGQVVGSSALTWTTFQFNFSANRLANRIYLYFFQYAESSSAFVNIGSICWYPRVTETPTSSRTPIAGTPTPSPTRTPQPTYTRSPTRTNTPQTYTPTPSLTNTPETYTPAPTSIPSETARGTSTLGVDLFSTPVGPDIDPACLDPTQGCSIFPPAQFPDIGIYSPSPVAAVATLTAFPSITRASSPTPGGTRVDTAPLVTRVAQFATLGAGMGQGTAIFSDGEGTPVDLPNAFNKAGGDMGSMFSILRGLTSGDIGQAGVLAVGILGLIGINLLVRVILFFIPIAALLITLFIQIVRFFIPGK